MTTDTILIFLAGSMASFSIIMWRLFRPRTPDRPSRGNSVVEVRISVSPELRVDSVRSTRAGAANSPYVQSAGYGEVGNDPATCVVDAVGLTQELDALILTSATEFPDRGRTTFPALPAK